MDAAGQVRNAHHYNDLFGAPYEPRDRWLKGAKKHYNLLAKQLHPDTGGDSALFAKLATLWEAAQHTPTRTIVGKKHTYTLTSPATRAGVATSYQVCWDDGHETGVLKLTKHEADNAALTNEARKLSQLNREVEPKYLPYFPTLVDTFLQKDPTTSAQRRAVVYSRHPNMVSLEQVKKFYPNGVDPRDWVWMFRRVLIATDLAHRAGILYLAATPDNVWCHPEQHGLVFENFTSSSDLSRPGTVSTVPKKYRHFYPPEVFDKHPLTTATDLYMLAKLSQHMVADPPPAMAAFFTGTALTKPSSRPKNAAQLLNEFDMLVKKLYGPPKFRTFTLPEKL